MVTTLYSFYVHSSQKSMVYSSSFIKINMLLVYLRCCSIVQRIPRKPNQYRSETGLLCYPEKEEETTLESGNFLRIFSIEAKLTTLQGRWGFGSTPWGSQKPNHSQGYQAVKVFSFFFFFPLHLPPILGAIWQVYLIFFKNKAVFPKEHT